MQQNKVIKNISEVGEYSSDSNILLKTFENIIGQFRLDNPVAIMPPIPGI